MSTNEERLRLIVVRYLNVLPEQVTAEANIFDDLGADSLDAVELVMAIEEEFGIEVSDSAAEEAHTFADLLALIPRAS